MRIISRAKLRAYWQTEAPDAENALRQWAQLVEEAGWTDPTDVKRTFGKRVDFVPVKSGRTLAVFDIRGNHYRLIAAVHYLANVPEKGRVYVLRLLTHRAYDLNRWKDEL